MMVRFSLKLVVLIASSLGFAAFLSWTNEYVAPNRNPQEPFKHTGRVDAGKRETHNESSDEEDSYLNPKLAWQLDARKLDNNDLPQAQQAGESQTQKSSDQRTNSNDNDELQFNELNIVNAGSSKTEDTKVESSQGTDAGIEEGNAKHDGRIQTFFSTLPTRFSELRLEGENEVPTKDFLQACHDLSPFLDKFGRSPLSMAHSDLESNARKIYAVYEADLEASPTLQKMVLTEFDNGDYKVDGKGTISLLWLKRGFEFLAEFLHRLSDGEEPAQAANTAYDHCLYPHHGYFIRATFKLALKTLQYRADLFKTLAVNPDDALHPNFDQIVSEDMLNYTKGLENILQTLRNFYTKQGLDN